MPIVKRQAPSHFTTLPNEMLADRRLSWEARGMLAFLLSASGDYNIATLEGVGDCGRERTMRILTELRDGGYLHLLQKNERGEATKKILCHRRRRIGEAAHRSKKLTLRTRRTTTEEPERPRGRTIRVAPRTGGLRPPQNFYPRKKRKETPKKRRPPLRLFGFLPRFP